MIGKGLLLKKVRFTKRGARQQQITFLRTLFPFSLLYAYNTAYTLRLRLALRDIVPYGRNVVYARNVNGR